MSVKEALGVHFFGVFWKEAVDDEVFAVCTFLVEFGSWAIRCVSRGNGAWNV